MNLFKHLLFGNFESYADEDSYKIFFRQQLFLILGMAIHLMYVCIFIYFDLLPMVCIELLSLFVLTAGVIINHKRVKYVPAFIMCIEVGSNGVLWAIALKSGYSHYLYTLVALLAVFLFLELKNSHKVILTVFLLICINIAHYAEYNVAAVISHKEKDWLALLALNMVFVMLTIELSINEIANRTIKRVHKETLRKMKLMKKEIIQDPLTKVYNRRYFQENEETLNKKAAKLSCCVAIMDIDHFKNINDTYGHDIGDKVLVCFAAKMKEEFRSSDVVIRWGGEEFVIFLSKITAEHAVEKLNRFRLLIQKFKLKTEKGIIKFTFTAGVCKIGDGMTVSDAVKKADGFLYEGKVAGRNRVIYK